MSAERRDPLSGAGDGVIFVSRKERMRGDDGHRILSVRVPNELAEQLEALAARTDRSRNELINLLLDAALKRVITPDQE